MAAYDFTGLYRFESTLPPAEEGDASLPARKSPRAEVQLEVEKLLHKAGLLTERS